MAARRPGCHRRAARGDEVSGDYTHIAAPIHRCSPPTPCPHEYGTRWRCECGKEWTWWAIGWMPETFTLEPAEKSVRAKFLRYLRGES